jgi:hypothetical protein
MLAPYGNCKRSLWSQMGSYRRLGILDIFSRINRIKIDKDEDYPANSV